MAAAGGVDGAVAGGPQSAPLRGAAAGRLRWAVNSEAWSPVGGHEGAEFQFLLGLIPEEAERAQVLKFVFPADKKRALLSRLLCRRASAAVLGLGSFAPISIGRTKGRKPFLLRPRPPESHLANFNFNVSHEGDWVVLASEPACVCGVDVAAPPSSRPGGAGVDIFRDFEDQLTAAEWAFVRKQAGRSPTATCEDPTYEAFQRLWSCKEAFVKARGDGLAFELRRAAFSFTPLEPGDSDSVPDAFAAHAEVDGHPAPMWSFFQHRLGGNHWVTVARGPTSDVEDAAGEFRSTLRRRTEDFEPGEWQRELKAHGGAGHFCAT